MSTSTSQRPVASPRRREPQSRNPRNTSTPSATVTLTQTTAPVLRLRGAPLEEGEGSERHVQWAEDVVNNEGLGRKKSKVCCIYHAPKQNIDDSSDDSSSDSSSDESDSGDDGSARPVGGRRGGHRGHGHGHDHGKGKGRAPSPNAYERQPKPKSGGTKEGKP
ncbi:phosphatase inhibitor-domain-containing protein [Bisporella sp. PMI_857]|nr:phosphatase inhibitor-domain-containing protein [Bisporella sp. PMI_857]